MKPLGSLLSSLSMLPLMALLPGHATAQCQTDRIPVGGVVGRVVLEGNTLAVVTIGDPGTVQLYGLQAGDWVLEATFPMPADVEPALLDGMLIVGAPFEPVGGVDWVGKVFVFRRDAGGWTQVQEILPDAVVELGLFGAAVDVQGDTLLVCEPGVWSARPGRVHVFRLVAGTWVLESAIVGSVDFGTAVSLDGDRVAVAATNSWLWLRPGEVFLFERSGGTWTEILRLVPTEVDELELGGSLLLEGSKLVLRSMLGAIPSTRRPCIRVFEERGGTWTQTGRFEDPSADDRDFRRFAFLGDRLLVGFANDDGLATRAGMVHVLRDAGAGWVPSDELYAADGGADHGFGVGVAAAGGTAAITSWNDLYLFELDPDCPDAAFDAAPLRGAAPLQVDFTDRSAGVVSEWTWGFGDGATSDLQQPSHIYTALGSRTVDLVVRGPAGADRALRRELVFVGAGASATVRNGSGVNPLRLANLSLPSLGGTWSAEVDTSAHPGATLGALQGRARGLPGRTTPWGELLIDHSSAHVFSSFGPPDAQGRVRFDYMVPDQLALSGLRLSTQGGILGGGGELLNAIDLVVGF